MSRLSSMLLLVTAGACLFRDTEPRAGDGGPTGDAAPVESQLAGTCADGLDNDGDGLTDVEDTDCSGVYRRPLSIEAGTESIPEGASVAVDFDHAWLVAAGKARPDGDDLRVLYDDGSGPVELDRVLDSSSVWGGAPTRVWFAIQAPIAAGARDASYALAYGNPDALHPPADPGRAFLFGDDFESGTLAKWTMLNGEEWTIDDAVAHNGSHSARADVWSGGRAWLIANGLHAADVTFEAYWRTTVDENDYRIDTYQLVRAATALPMDAYGAYFESDDVPQRGWQLMKFVDGSFSESGLSDTTNRGTVIPFTWHKVTMDVRGAGEVRLFVDDVQVLPPTGWSVDAEESHAVGSVGFSVARLGDLDSWWVDDAVVRRLLLDPPTVIVGAEIVL